MKSNLAIILNIASALIIFDALGIGYKLMVFLFVGVIPFTNVTLSSSQMMALMLTLAVMVIVRLGIYPLIKKSKFNPKFYIQTKLSTKRLSRI